MKEKRAMLDYTGYLKRLQQGDYSENPFLDFLGITLDEIGDGYVRFTMETRTEFMQANGVMQGGLIVAMADESIAHAIMTLMEPHEGIATVEVKNNFLSTVGGGTLIAEATVFKKGRSLVVGDCIVTTDEGRAVARSSATFLICRE